MRHKIKKNAINNGLHSLNAIPESFASDFRRLFASRLYGRLFCRIDEKAGVESIGHIDMYVHGAVYIHTSFRFTATAFQTVGVLNEHGCREIGSSSGERI